MTDCLTQAPPLQEEVVIVSLAKVDDADYDANQRQANIRMLMPHGPSIMRHGKPLGLYLTETGHAPGFAASRLRGNSDPACTDVLTE